MANALVKFLSDGIGKALRVDQYRGEPKPRKGLYHFANTTVSKKQQKPVTINSATLKRLADTDPITWSIRRAIKGYISQTSWDIVPDTQCTEAELDRWEDSIVDSINPYGMDIPDFSSDVLDKELQADVEKKLEAMLGDNLDDQEKRTRVRWLFKSTIKKVRNEAESHKHEVKARFEHPNTTDKTFRALLELILDDILIFDSGILVKNYDHYNRFAEWYTLPGHEIKIYRNEDRTIPKPPEPAYVWETQGSKRAEYTAADCAYISQNPQQNGYGKSPLEVAAYVITGSLYADEYNIDYFKHSNVPPALINLGKDVSAEEREVFKRLWDQEIQGRAGLHRLLVTSGSEKIQFIPMRNMSNRDMQMMEYLKWATAIKCACYGISPQDIGFVLDFHRTTAEVQEQLSQRRGIKSLLNLLECVFNENIVKAEFPYQDVKFEWQIDEPKQSIKQAQIDKLDIDLGVLSRNERRKKIGLKPIEGGDEYVISGGGQLTPVEDLAKINDPNEVTPEQEMQELQALGLPPTAGQSPTSGNGKPGPDPKVKVHGDAGRPTKENENEIKMVVNKNKPYKKQKEMLDKAVEQLKKQGINATIKIGFEDEEIIDKDSKD